MSAREGIMDLRDQAIRFAADAEKIRDTYTHRATTLERLLAVASDETLERVWRQIHLEAAGILPS